MYGETNETPLTLKGFRLMLNFWQRVTNLPDSSLTKKALLENIALRTNWIITIEKLLGNLALTEHIENMCTFREKARDVIQTKFTGVTMLLLTRVDCYFINPLKISLSF